MGATPNYYEAVKICNGSLRTPYSNELLKIGDDFSLGGNSMVRSFIFNKVYIIAFQPKINETDLTRPSLNPLPRLWTSILRHNTTHFIHPGTF